MAGRSPQSRARSTVAHQQARRNLILRTRPGTPCPRCLKPMTAVGGVWGAGLDADHLGTLAMLNPHALPDALSHAACNRAHGGALSRALRGITNSVERARIAEEVTEEMHARLRGQKHKSPPRIAARRRVRNNKWRGYDDSPQPRPITKW